MPKRLSLGGAFILAGLGIAAPAEISGQPYGVRVYGAPPVGWWFGAGAYRPAYVGGYRGYFPGYPAYPRYYVPVVPVIPRYVYAPPVPVIYAPPPPPPPPPVRQCPDGSTIPAGAYCPAPPEPVPAAPAAPVPAVPPPTPERG